MALVVNRETFQVIPLANTPDYPPEQWLINPVMPEGVPYRYLKVVGDEIVEMSAEEKYVVDNPPVPILVRHALEQQAGVPLQNGWRIKYGKADRDELGALKNTIDLVGDELEALGQKVPIFEADGTLHQLLPSEMRLILKEYTMLALVEYSRQATELSQQ